MGGGLEQNTEGLASPDKEQLAGHSFWQKDS